MSYIENQHNNEECLQYVDTPLGTKVVDMIKEFASLSTILRIFGAATVIAAMSLFLMQSWDMGDDINRYFLLLGQTLLLSVGGFGLSFILKENKGARVFFGLGLLSVTVNMTTLGAILYSTLSFGGTATGIPEFAQWSASGIGSVIPAIGASIIMLPIVFFSFMIFARNSAKLLSVLFLVSNALLLIPLRDSILVSMVVIIGVFMPIVVLAKNMQKDRLLRTFEGYFAMMTVFVPSVIIIVRNVWFYQVDEILRATLALTAYVALRFMTKALDKNEEKSDMRYLWDFISLILAVFVALPIFQMLNGLSSLAFAYSLPAFMFLFLNMDIAKRSNSSAYAIIGALTLMGVHIFLLINVPSFLSAIFTIAAGAVLLKQGVALKEKSIFVFGVIMVVVGIIFQIYRIVAVVDVSAWMSLAIIGAFTIVLASVTERYGAIAKVKFTKWTESVF